MTEPGYRYPEHYAFLASWFFYQEGHWGQVLDGVRKTFDLGSTISDGELFGHVEQLSTNYSSQEMSRDLADDLIPLLGLRP